MNEPITHGIPAPITTPQAPAVTERGHPASPDVTITHIANPLQPHGSRTITTRAHVPGMTYRQYLAQQFRLPPADLDICAAVNGAVLPAAALDRPAAPGDSIVCAFAMRGGRVLYAVPGFQAWGALANADVPGLNSDTQKSIARTTALLAVMAVGAMSAAGIGGVAGLITGGGIALSGAVAVNAMVPQAPADFGGVGADSATYGWEAKSNPTREGNPLPVLYGRVRVTPPVIAQSVSVGASIGQSGARYYDQYLNMLFAVAEGPLTTLSDVEINDQPLANFTAAEIETRLGASSQSPLTYWVDTAAENAVNRQLSGTSYVTVTTDGTAVQGLGVGMSWPVGLMRAGGDVRTQRFSLEYRLAGSSGAWLPFTNGPIFTVQAAFQKPARTYYRVDGLAPGQYEVRAIVTADDGSGTAMLPYMEYVEEIIYDDLTYPNTALLSLRALATGQLSGAAPRVTVLAERATVQVWTGAAYESKDASNPAWAAWDLLHNARYGGDVAKERIIYADFVAWAAWCVTKGLTVNLYLDSAESLATKLARICECGRASIVQRGTSFSCIVDMPTDPVQLFTIGNIVKDSFEETFLSLADRANVAEITFVNAEDGWKNEVVEVRAADFDTSDEEIRKLQLTLYGVTNRETAIRHGRFLLNCNQYLTRTCAFEADVDAIACMVGDVIRLQHDVPQWGYGGRIVTAGASSVTLDRTVHMDPGTVYKVMLRHSATDTIEERTVAAVGVPTDTAVLTLTAPWSTVPAQFDLYSFGASGSVTKLFRVISITRSQELTRRITCLEYRAEVYADTGTIPTFPNESDLSPVKALAARELWQIGTDGTGFSTVLLSWRGQAVAWNVWVREVAEIAQPWRQVAFALTFPEFEIPRGACEIGKSYQIAVGDQDKPPAPELWTAITLMGKSALPTEPTNFRAGQNGRFVTLAWDHIADADLWGYEIRLGASWDAGRRVIDGIQKNLASYAPPQTDATLTFWLKAIDMSGNRSTTAVSATVDFKKTGETFIDRDELTKVNPCDGTKTRMAFIDAPTPLLAWLPGLSDTDVPADWTDTTAEITDYAGDVGDGVYESLAIDAARIGDLTAGPDFRALMTLRDPTDTMIAARTDRTFPLDTDTAVTGLVGHVEELRTSPDGVTWTAWAPWTMPVLATARYWQFRCTVASDDALPYFAYDTMRTVLEATHQRAQVAGQAVDAGGTTITLASLGVGFFVQYTVAAQALGTSAAVPVIDRAASQFTIYLKDSSGAGVSGSVDFTVEGY